MECCAAEVSTSLVTLDNTPMTLAVRRDSLSSVTSQNKQTFQRLIGSFRTAVGGRDDATDTLPCEWMSAGLITVMSLRNIITVTTHPENFEKSGNLKLVREKSRKLWFASGVLLQL